MQQPTSYPNQSTKQMNLGRGAGYGMDAELDDKRVQKYDATAEQQAQNWIEAVTGEQFGDQSFGDALKSGVVLCQLINKIRPNTVRKINQMKMPFMQMENIAMFLQGCRFVGVADHDCFETVDLYEQKDLGVVVSCLHALGRAVQKNVPTWNGPVLGPKEADKNMRKFTREQLNAGKSVLSKFSEGSSQTMEQLEVTRTGITFGADYVGSDGDNTMTLLGMGSKDIMERAPITKPGITFGAENAGQSSYGDNTVPLLGLGSKDVMERIDVTKTGITFGADSSGSSYNGADNTVPMLGLGSKDVMERIEVTKTGITFGADASSPKDEVVDTGMEAIVETTKQIQIGKGDASDDATPADAQAILA
jgi:hypothetical protein